MNFADNFKKVRTSKKLTQKELASKIGVTQSAVAKWETSARVPSTREIRRVSKALNISVSRLIGYKEDKNTSLVKDIEGKLGMAVVCLQEVEDGEMPDGEVLSCAVSNLKKAKRLLSRIK